MDRFAGTGGKVLRIVSLAALLAVVAAGCGGATPRTTVHGMPRVLAQEWEGQASAIASAAAAGNDCQAMRLAATLRDEVSASRRKLPPRLRTPLLTGVNALADRISTCTRVVTVQGPPKGPKPKPPHGPPKHHHGNGDGGGNDQ